MHPVFFFSPVCGDCDLWDPHMGLLSLQATSVAPLLPQHRIASCNFLIISLPQPVRQSLKRWIKPHLFSWGTPLKLPPQRLITRDASYGVGGRYIAMNKWPMENGWLRKPKTTSARWISAALSTFPCWPVSKCYMGRTSQYEQTSSKYIDKALSLHQECKWLLQWMESHHISITDQYFYVNLNTKANWQNRSELNPTEWSLHWEVFYQIQFRFRTLMIVHFTSPLSGLVKRFMTRYSSHRAQSIDALVADWPPGLLYAYSATPLLSKVMHWIFHFRAEIILLAPHWPRRSSTVFSSTHPDFFTRGIPPSSILGTSTRFFWH